jgi:hypothetical protein
VAFAWLTGGICQNAVLISLECIIKVMPVAQVLSLRRLSSPRCPRRLCQVLDDSFLPVVLSAVARLLTTKDFWCVMDASLVVRSQNLRSIISIDAIVLRPLSRAPL